MGGSTEGSASGSPRIGDLLRWAVALTTAGAGIVHLSAARDHPAHPHIVAFFAVLAVLQLALAVALVSRPRLLRWALFGNAAVVGLWLVTRATGLPFVPGADQAEAIALKDVLATLLELTAIGGAGLVLVMPRPALRAIVKSGERASTALVGGVIVLTVAGTLAPHGLGDEHSHGDASSLASHGDAPPGDDGHHGHEGGEPHVAGGEVASHHLETVPAPAAGHTGHGHAEGVATEGAYGDHAGHEGSAAGGSARNAGARGDVPRFEPTGEANVVRYGPFTVPPASSNDLRHGNVVLSNTVLTRLPPPCTDCYLTALDFDLVYDDGSTANFDTGVMLHHHVMFNSAEDDATCGRSEGLTGPGGQRIFATGNERTGIVFPAGFGYHVAPESWWTGVFDIMNHVDQPQTVWVELRVHQVTDPDPEMRPLTPIWLDVDNCSDSEYEVPAGRSETRWQWRSDLTGRIVAAGGHVHDAGLSITLANDTTGAQVCRSVAGYGTDPAYLGHIESMSVCEWDRIGTVRAGEELSITTVYDSAEPQDDVMGIMMAFIYETADLDGGTPAPRSVTDPPERTSSSPPPTEHHH